LAGYKTHGVFHEDVTVHAAPLAAHFSPCCANDKTNTRRRWLPEFRPKSVPVQFLVATDVAKALVEQLPIAVTMAELQKQQGG
jgi:hypothetical protein